MIRINLLKGASPRRGRSAVPVALLIRIGIAVVAGLVIIVVGAGLMRWLLARPHTGQHAVVATIPLPAPEKKVVPEMTKPVPCPEKKTVSEKACCRAAGAFGTETCAIARRTYPVPNAVSF